MAYLARAVAQVDRTRAEALAALVRVLVGEGAADRAEELVHAVAHEHERDVALAELARAVAGAGDHDRAEAVIRCIIDPDSKANAMIDLARVAPSRTRVLLAQALQLGDWTKPLALLSQVEPAAVIAAADEFLTRDARG